MKTWIRHKRQTTVKLSMICATLFIVTHCQISPDHQTQNPGTNQNAQGDDLLDKKSEKSGHISGSGEQHQHAQSSTQHHNVGSMDTRQNQEEDKLSQHLQGDAPNTQQWAENAHDQHHFQFDGSYTDKQGEQQGSAGKQSLDKNPQNQRNFGRDQFHHIPENELNARSHHHQQQQEHHGNPDEGVDHSYEYHHQQQPHNHLHEEPPHPDITEDDYFVVEEYETDLPTQEDINKMEHEVEQYADKKDSPMYKDSVNHLNQHHHHPQNHFHEDQLHPDKLEDDVFDVDEEDIPLPQDRQRPKQPMEQHSDDKDLHLERARDTQKMEEAGEQHKADHSSWPQSEPQSDQEDRTMGQVSPSQESPSYQQNTESQPVIPPVLTETVTNGADPDSENENDGEEEETKESEPEMTPEEKEANELFLAGEKLINATYYKEYHEAYLNFLEAAKLNHQRAKEYVAFGHLFGDYLPQNVTKSAQLFEELAARGSPKAQMGLAFMYSAGFYYNSSQAKALIYSTFGALGGDPLAQMALGYRYYAGIGVESTCETALTYYRKVATKVADSVTLAGGPVVQRISLQDEAENVGTNNSPMLDDDLLQYYHFLADKGDQQAQVVLGTLYYQGGKGVQINHDQAYHYFSTAAESGSGHALGYLGKMHSEGSPFIRQNNQTAFEYFKKSSEKNNHIGQAGLGMMYLNGLGVDKDVTKAFRYFSLASDQGSVDGQLQLGIMYFSGNGVRTDYKLAVKYFTMASQKGHVLAYYNLAQMHATGTGVLRNCHTAVELFKNVAERGKWSEMLMDAHRMYHEGNVDTALVKYMFLADLGYEVAQSNVAYLLDSGASLKFNMHETHQRALLQYSRAASQGSPLARLRMGDYYYYGLGTDVDYESAASHYRMASEQQNNAQAMFNLGYMHERGLGLKQDVHLAKRFYDMAAETSVDAHVPVTMALLKLGLLYGVDVFSKEFEGVSGLLSLLDPVAYLGPQWDLILASALAGFLTIIYILRRMR